ncbi:MAG: flagellar assembly protein FliW [Verrucomicrobiales bacterium]|nr:flagellar assembly protein FliW [Verrucomicrobiales bacterium]
MPLRTAKLADGFLKTFKNMGFKEVLALARPLLLLFRRMNSELQIEEKTPESTGQLALHLPLGLLGFERIKRYLLIPAPEAAPFYWLQMAGEPSLAFLVVPPEGLIPNYFPEISSDDVAFLKLNDSAEAGILNIVILNPGGRATVNLKGPIVFNRKTLKGKQVILSNANDFGLKHPLPLAS